MCMHAGHLKIKIQYTYIILTAFPLQKCLLKIKNTHIKLTAFPLQKWLHERASLLRYTYIACLIIVAEDIGSIEAVEKRN